MTAVFFLVYASLAFQCLWTSMVDRSLVHSISNKLKLDGKQVRNALELLQDGCAIPFIAHYRMEQTGTLREDTLWKIQEALRDHEELAAAKSDLARSLEAKGRLTDEMRLLLEACHHESELEDLSFVYKPKGHSKAAAARERGLGPLAMMILMQRNPRRDIDSLASKLADPGGEIPSPDAAIDGALDILGEQIYAEAEARRFLRDALWRQGKLVSRVIPGKEEEGKKFKPYFAFKEPVRDIPLHHLLAIRRGEGQGVLQSDMEIDHDKSLDYFYQKVIHTSDDSIVGFLRRALKEGYFQLLLPERVREVREQLLRDAEEQAIDVFTGNLRKMLLAPPALGLRVLGIDPNYRSARMAALDADGNYLEAATIHFGHSEKRLIAATQKILSLVQKHRIDAICIGAGPGTREVDTPVREAIRQVTDRKVLRVLCNKAGAAVYAASDLGREELPQLDVATRAAVSIARRFHDPLAELVKIDPKFLSVGQYQEEVDPERLKIRLEQTVVSCVHATGVDLNRASAALLARVAGLSPSLASQLIAGRNAHGPFTSRAQLATLPDFSPKVLQQAAGFLRIRQGPEPLDATPIHPERYPLVETMAASIGMTVAELLQNPQAADKIQWRNFISQTTGKPTLKRIREEIKHNGKDPRDVFDPAAYGEEPRDPGELKEGMILVGTVTNVTYFGAFVDLGMNQDGLIHVSQLSRKFVSDPSTVVSVGDRVTVKVTKVDPERKRVSLSMKQATRRPGAATAGPAPSAAPAASVVPVAQAVPPGQALADGGNLETRATPDPSPTHTETVSPTPPPVPVAAAPTAKSPMAAENSTRTPSSAAQSAASESQPQGISPPPVSHSLPEATDPKPHEDHTY